MGNREDTALDLVVSLHRLLRSLRKASPMGGLQPTQLLVLAMLRETGPCRVGVLAARVPCSQPTATAAVAELEGPGLVRREPDPADGRATRVALTEEGERALRGVAHGEAEVLLRRLGTLPPGAAERLLAAAPALRLLAEATETGAADAPAAGG